MAPLKDSPRESVIYKLPLPISSDASDPVSDAEAANQQLLSESRSPAAQAAPPPAAVLGVNLLNAARIGPNSAVGSMARKDGSGKLKRASMVAERPKQNLARRGDLYDIELSPEKGAYALPEKVNRKPLKVMKKMGKVKTKGDFGGQRGDALGIPSGLPVHRAIGVPSAQDEFLVNPAPTDPSIPSSPPETALAGSHTIIVDGAGQDAPPIEAESETGPPGRVRIEESLVNGKPRCTAVSYKYDKKLGSRYQQCLRPSAGRNHVGARCGIHMNKSPTVQCGEMVVSEHGTSQCHRTATTDTINGARCLTHAENQQQEPSNKRKSGLNHGNDRPSKVQRVKKRNPSRPERSEKTKAQARDVPETSSRHTSDSEREGDSNMDPATKISKPPKKPGDNPVVSSQQLPKRTRTSSSHPEQSEPAPVAPELAPVDEDSDSDSESDSESESEAREDEPDISQDNVPEYTGPGNLDKVFMFLDLEERSGRCQMKFATTIRRMCDNSCSHLQDESISMDTVIEDAADIQEALERVDSKIRHKDRSEFKGDAYGYVFRSLTLYLEGLYSWLLQTHQTVDKSLEATRVMTRLIHAILAFKDTIASWDVSIPQSYKGGRVIKDVDIRLIAPLRQVYKIFKVRLSKLEDTEQLRVRYAETKRKMQEQRDAESMRIETIEAKNKRKKRWQDLHIVRMQCEPDKYRRYKLYTTRIEDLEERDANGMVFERLPIFRPRSTQPQSSVAEPADVLKWTDEEEIALLGGLEQCTGPDAFERIFKTYCHPNSAHPGRGILRNRSVTEIALKARSFRSQLLAQYQNEGWPIPNWITNIIVLP